MKVWLISFLIVFCCTGVVHGLENRHPIDVRVLGMIEENPTAHGQIAAYGDGYSRWVMEAHNLGGTIEQALRKIPGGFKVFQVSDQAWKRLVEKEAHLLGIVFPSLPNQPAADPRYPFEAMMLYRGRALQLHALNDVLNKRPLTYTNRYGKDHPIDALVEKLISEDPTPAGRRKAYGDGYARWSMAYYNLRGPIEMALEKIPGGTKAWTEVEKAWDSSVNAEVELHNVVFQPVPNQMMENPLYGYVAMSLYRARALHLQALLDVLGEGVAR